MRLVKFKLCEFGRGRVNFILTFLKYVLNVCVLKIFVKLNVEAYSKHFEKMKNIRSANIIMVNCYNIVNLQILAPPRISYSGE